MADNDIEFEVERKPRKFIAQWFLPILFKPRKTIDEIAEKEHAVWIAPLLALMISALILVLVSSSLVGQSSQGVSDPEMFEYYSPEQQQQYQDAVIAGYAQPMQGSTPYIIWGNWFLIPLLSLLLFGVWWRYER